MKDRIKKLKSLITCLKCKVSGRECDDNCETAYNAGNMGEIIENLEEISKILEKTGEWLRLSELPEQIDSRYKCSRCGNVVHYRERKDLYTFNRWCGRCGSDNSRREGKNYE